MVNNTGDYLYTLGMQKIKKNNNNHNKIYKLLTKAMPIIHVVDKSVQWF